MNRGYAKLAMVPGRAGRILRVKSPLEVEADKILRAAGERVIEADYSDVFRLHGGKKVANLPSVPLRAFLGREAPVTTSRRAEVCFDCGGARSPSSGRRCGKCYQGILRQKCMDRMAAHNDFSGACDQMVVRMQRAGSDWSLDGIRSRVFIADEPTDPPW